MATTTVRLRYTGPNRSRMPRFGWRCDICSKAEVSPSGGSGPFALASKRACAASASAMRPWVASQRGDSGTVLGSVKNSTSGMPPRKYITSQPKCGTSQAPSALDTSKPIGNTTS
ncbi:hypothetical protein DL770_011505 [Monosporascus sp. CRB-9-2]|nr:hypothetical protein DL770_011505 [Monosporascus sp. CRB-9-2]